MRIFLMTVSVLLVGCNSNFSTAPEKGGMPPEAMTAMESGDQPQMPSADHPPIAGGEISMAPALKGKVQTGSVLFVIAKPSAGGPPLAVKKMEVSTFPVSFALMPQDIMMKGMPMDGTLEVIARIDKDGMAGPASSGDMEGRTAKPVSMGTAGIQIKIDKVY
ncbi:MAG: hypothetical protein Q7T03_04715 [Deltaproteobacteria bacterium]|nr:hypothetical protein [Deltaproteobacteria bacterium]